MSTVAVWGWKINKDVRVRKFPRKEESDESTCQDLVQDDSAKYESDRYESQSGDRDYVNY